MNLYTYKWKNDTVYVIKTYENLQVDLFLSTTQHTIQ